MPSQNQVPQIDFNDMAIQFIAESHRTPRYITWISGILNGSIGWVNKNFWNYCYGNSNASEFSSLVSYQINDISITYAGVFISTVNGNLNNNPSQTLEYSETSTYEVGNSIIYGTEIINDVQYPIYYICNTDILSPESFNINNWTLISAPVWYQISPSYIGAQERIQYSSQKLTMEYALNRWFRTVFRNPTSLEDGSSNGVWYLPLSDIYIKTVNFSYGSFGVATQGVEQSSVSVNPGIYGFGSSSITLSSTTYKFVVYIPSLLSSLLGSNYIQIISEVVDKMNQIGVTYTIEIY